MSSAVRFQKSCVLRRAVRLGDGHLRVQASDPRREKKVDDISGCGGKEGQGDDVAFKVPPPLI